MSISDMLDAKRQRLASVETEIEQLQATYEVWLQRQQQQIQQRATEHQQELGALVAERHELTGAISALEELEG